MNAAIYGIEYFLPEKTLPTEELSQLFPDWNVASIDAKTGIHNRHIAGENECASDLAVCAVRKLFAAGVCSPDNIDILLLCTQSPDYLIPTTACLMQSRLGLPTTVGALDINLGCSGYVYGLGLAQGLIASGQARAVLLVTAETYSKYINSHDRSTRTIFGDGAAATLVSAHYGDLAPIGPFVYGTNGAGGNDLILQGSGTRGSCSHSGDCTMDDRIEKKHKNLYMNGGRMFAFATTIVPLCVQSLLAKARITCSEVDLFVFHQANGYILEELRRILNIDREKLQMTISESGNTTSSTIPIALKHAEQEGRLWEGARVVLVGFGVGHSWGATLIRWTRENQKWPASSLGVL